ncbi:MAG: hypothetical protein AAF572_27765 [Cyanobacteria bacterium P01_B01_bin.77]
MNLRGTDGSIFFGLEAFQGYRGGTLKLALFAIAAATYRMGSHLFRELSDTLSLALRFAGFIIFRMGGTFALTLMMESIFPA